MLTAEGLRALHSNEPLSCPTPGCAVFPFETQAELDDHITKGDHVVRDSTKRAEPNLRRGTKAAAGGSVVNTIRPATEPQVEYIKTLLAERKGNVEAEKWRTNLNKWFKAPGGLTFAAASGALDALKLIPRNPAPAPEPTEPAQPKGFKPRPNMYSGTCEECGRTVAANEGLLLGKGDDGKWAVSHKPGECQDSDFPFPFGRYALREDDDLVKFYVASEDGLFAQASDDLFPLRNAEHRAQVIAAIEADPKAAAALYGQELGACGRCGRSLTSEWRKVGLGPVCSKKGW